MQSVSLTWTLVQQRGGDAAEAASGSWTAMVSAASRPGGLTGDGAGELPGSGETHTTTFRVMRHHVLKR